jgi:hypothetical protein
VISPYDVDLDRGIQDFKTKLSQVVSDAASKANTPDGTFDAYRKSYSDLEIGLVMLRDRAFILEAKDVNCSVPAVVKEVLAKFQKASAVMTVTTSAPPNAAPAVVAATDPAPVSPMAIGRQKNLPVAVGCMTRLIDNIALQLTSIETIHARPELCANKDQPALTCMRPAAAAGALAAANDSLDAAQIVQVYKNQGGE